MICGLTAYVTLQKASSPGEDVHLSRGNRLEVLVTLRAEDDTGRQITSRQSFGLKGPKRGLGAVWWRYHGPKLSGSDEVQIDLIDATYRVGIHDIEDGINMMLGRDVSLPSPPLLAWAPLLETLRDADIYVTEQDLITLPLQIIFDDEVIAAIKEA